MVTPVGPDVFELNLGGVSDTTLNDFGLVVSFRRNPHSVLSLVTELVNLVSEDLTIRNDYNIYMIWGRLPAEDKARIKAYAMLAGWSVSLRDWDLQLRALPGAPGVGYVRAHKSVKAFARKLASELPVGSAGMRELQFQTSLLETIASRGRIIVRG